MNNIYKLACIAVLCLMTASCNNKSEPQKYISRANSHLASGNADSAIEVLRSALFDNPQNQDLIYALGDVYIRVGKWDSLRSFMRIAAMDQSTIAHFESKIGEHEFRQENWASAARHFESAAENTPPLCFGPHYIYLLNAALAFFNDDQHHSVERLYVKAEVSWDSFSCANVDPVVDPSSDLALFINTYLEDSVRAMAQFRELIANVEDIASAKERAYSECIFDARQDYAYRWSEACKQQARSLRQQFEYCVESQTQANTWRSDRYQAERNARRYCQAAYGEIDESPECSLPSERARRLEARRELAERNCKSQFRS